MGGRWEVGGWGRSQGAGGSANERRPIGFETNIRYARRVDFDLRAACRFRCHTLHEKEEEKHMMMKMKKKKKKV